MLRLYRGSKYRNIPTRIDGIFFQSKKEARRYTELKAMEMAGHVENLERQVRFRLVVDGFHIVDYVCDFRYFDTQRNCEVVEDVKGARSGNAWNLFQIKRRLMLACHGIDVEVV